MSLTEFEKRLLSMPTGICKPKKHLEYLLYTEHNWKEVQNFCLPFSIDRTRRGADRGRAVIDLPTGNETFEYGMILVRIGKTRILICSISEFEDLFHI